MSDRKDNRAQYRGLDETFEGIASAAKWMNVRKGFVLDVMLRAYTGKTPRSYAEWTAMMKAERSKG